MPRCSAPLSCAVCLLLLAPSGCDAPESDEAQGPAPSCGEASATPPRDPEFRSNTPDAVLSTRTTDDAAGLVVVSSNYVQDDADPGALRWWHAEIRNDGQTTLCFAKAGVVFQTADGTVMSAMDLYFDASPYEGSSEFSLPCLAPGEHGFGSTLDAAPWVAPLAELSTIDVSLDASAYDNVQPHPLAPPITAVQSVVEADGDVAVAGSICNDRSDLHFVWVNAYGITESGLVDLEYDTFYEDTFARGDVWDFEISSYGDGSAVAEVMAFVDFTEGAADAGETAVVDSMPGLASAPAGPQPTHPPAAVDEREQILAYRAHHRRLRAAR